MAQRVADQFVEILAAAGVKRIYGIVGDSLNGLTDALRHQGKIEWIHVRHEEVAAFAAAGEAHLTGELAVCARSCGPGNLHLINGLFDCHRSRLPVLAIAAQIPSRRAATRNRRTHAEGIGSADGTADSDSRQRRSRALGGPAQRQCPRDDALRLGMPRGARATACSRPMPESSDRACPQGQGTRRVGQSL
jgi:hypothetical protein